MSPALPDRPQLDWGKLSSLRIKAKLVADGAYAGSHLSLRKGAGVEFGGYRNYVPGDDIRWLERRALLRHGKLLVRQFETETDRRIILLLDASRSMAYRSELGPCPKLEYASLLALALARVAVASHDLVGLNVFGGRPAITLSPRGGVDAFERMSEALEDLSANDDLSERAEPVESAMLQARRQAARGTMFVLLSDLVDLPETAALHFAELAGQDRRILVVSILDPQEAEFRFDGPVRLSATEGSAVVETEATDVRMRYLAALSELHGRWRDLALMRRGGFIAATTLTDPIDVVRQALLMLEQKVA